MKWINRLRKWVWVGQALPENITLGLFKSEGLEKSSKYGCLTTSALIYLRVCFTNGARIMAFIIMAKVAYFVFPLITQRTITFTPDHGMIPFKKSSYTQEGYVFGNWSVVAVLCLLFPQLKIV